MAAGGAPELVRPGYCAGILQLADAGAGAGDGRRVLLLAPPGVREERRPQRVPRGGALRGVRMGRLRRRPPALRRVLH